jgi:uncharacterized protein (TIGR02118 family)
LVSPIERYPAAYACAGVAQRGSRAMVDERSFEARRSCAGETPGPPRSAVRSAGGVGEVDEVGGAAAVVGGLSVEPAVGVDRSVEPPQPPNRATGINAGRTLATIVRTVTSPGTGAEPTWPAETSGRGPVLTPRAMAVKITITFGRPVDADAFERHYVDVHAPLVRDLPGLRAYEFGRALTNFDGSPPDAFWVVSLTFADEDAMRASFASAAGQLTVDDMPNFITGTMTSVVSEVR